MYLLHGFLVNKMYNFAETSEGPVSGTVSIHEEVLSKQYDVYLSGPIEGAEEFVDLFKMLDRATTQDFIHIHINSPGGYLNTAIQIRNKMLNTQAHVTCTAEGECASAATLIFLSGDTLAVYPDSIFMIHNYSGGNFGKGGEMYASVSFMKSWWEEKMMKEIYKDFLTPKEIADILTGADVYLSGVEVGERLKKLHKE